MSHKAIGFIDTNLEYSTTKRIIRVGLENFDGATNLNDSAPKRHESPTLLPLIEGRQGEGGLRTKSYLKVGEPDFFYHSRGDRVNNKHPSRPLITVVTPVFNGEKFLEEAILSVINQDYDNVEYIVIDGGSTDGTLDIIKKYENAIDYWVSERDGGMYEAINKGFSVGRGDIFAWLNSDDRYNLGAFDLVVKAMGCFGSRWVTGVPTAIDMRGVLIGVEHPKFYSRQLIEKGFFRGDRLGFIQQEGTFFAAELYRRHPLKTELRLAGDFHLWCSFAMEEKLVTIKTALASFRIHKGQKSSDMNAYLSECDGLAVSFLWRMIPRIKPIVAVLRIMSILMDHKLVKPSKHL